MPELARREQENRYYVRREYNTNMHTVERETYTHQSQYTQQSYQNYQQRGSQLRSHKLSANQKKIERNYLIHRIVSVAVVSALALTVLPYGFNKITKNIFIFR